MGVVLRESHYLAKSGFSLMADLQPVPGPSFTLRARDLGERILVGAAAVNHGYGDF